MTYLIQVTHPWHYASVSTEYDPKEFEAETPEQAAQIFREQAGPGRLDLSRVVERLADGKEVLHQDRESGRTVVAQVVGTHIVEVTHPYKPDDRFDHRIGPVSLERAAEVFESESEPARPETASFIEELKAGERLESFNEETGKLVLAFEAVPAGVV